MQLFLRIYAVVYLVLYFESLTLMGSRGTPPSIIHMVDLIFFTPVAVLGLWSAAYRHVSLGLNGWKVLLFLSVFWRPLAVGNSLISGNAIAQFQKTMGGLTAKMNGDNATAVTLLAAAGVCLLGSLVILPPLFALYRNAYGDESLLKLMSSSHPRPNKIEPAINQYAEVAARHAAEKSL